MTTGATREQVARLDEVAIQEVGFPLFAMMENAGRILARVARELEDAQGPFVVLAGKGNNGGGGLAAARHLVNAGETVIVVPMAPEGDLAPAAAAQARILLAMGVGTSPDIPQEGTFLDALLGYNLEGAPRPPYDAAIEALQDVEGPLVSLDLPSGLHPDSGETPGVAVHADATVTLAVAKRGLLTGEGPAVAGRVGVADLGVPAVAYAKVGLERPEFAGSDVLWSEGD